MIKEILCLLCFVIAYGSQAQVSKQISKERSSLRKALNKERRTLTQTKRQRQQTKYKQRKLKKHINSAMVKLDSAKGTLGDLELSLYRKNIVIRQLDKDMDAGIAQMEFLLRQLYLDARMKTPAWMVILSASSVAEAYEQYVLTRALESQRRQQLALVKVVLGDLLLVKYDLTSQRDSCAIEADTYLSVLEERQKDLKHTEQRYHKLRSRERGLNSKIRKKQKAILALNKKIEQAIAMEVRKAKQKKRRRKIPHKRSRTTPKYSAALIGAPRFSSLKGRLPWPLKGKVVRKFGDRATQEHPDVRINSNGIDILNTRDKRIKAVADGTVSQVFAMPNLQNLVLVQHGDYFTCYANISKVKVTTGQVINAGQLVGETAYSPLHKGYLLHFELWKNTVRINPLRWLKR